MNPPNESFYFNKEEPYKSCFLSVRDLILSQGTEINETTKYGMPCFCWHKKMFCYLWSDKKTQWPYILFVEGKLLNHPLLESGNRKRMKTLTINPTKDLPVDLICNLLQQAIAIYKN